MKVYIQVVDTRTGIYQCGVIDEPVTKGLEINNALTHFGINPNDIKLVQHCNFASSYYGEVEGTTKVVSIITQVVPDQPSCQMQV